ncbi:MAG: 3-hydroxyacyl-CoA dehydrogenase family protein, partial [Eudoraea sp.]|uniref:3-hydroxyacyl-CoA dehydrogenase family protein n=1 Tax=Eudoraea sp. TaxID=1979955 RepID=UPI003C72103C
IMDIIGMETLYNVDMLWGEKLGDQTMLDRAAFIKNEYIDKGKMGMSSGEGFYRYPNPKYEDKNFLNS